MPRVAHGFHSVHNQIQSDLLQLNWIGCHNRRFTSEIRFEVYVVGMQWPAGKYDYLLNEFGAPFLPKLAELAKGNLAFAVGVMVLLMVVTVGYLPIVLPLLLPGVTVDLWQIARSLILLMLLPLAAGLALKAYYEGLAARVKPILDWISNISLILLVLLITAANIDKVLQVFGTFGILAGLLFIALGVGIGWLLGGSDVETKRVMALGTGQRNIAAALVVASQSFDDPKVVVMVIVVAIVGLVTICRSRGCWERARNPASCDRDRRRTGGCAPNYDARADPTGLQTNSREGP